MKFVYCLFLYLLATSCHRPPPLSGHARRIYKNSGVCSYHRHFDREALQPLKEQWPELYRELRRGGIQLCDLVTPQDTTAKSYRVLYSDLVDGSMQQSERMDSVPFLSVLNNFLLVYGPPTHRRYLEVPDQPLILLVHRPLLTDNIFMNNLYGHEHYFDATTGRRLSKAEYGKIVKNTKYED